ncbi:Asp-tRNA(Asn)/Glu-tRNA(Gln) amidotransferase subunit GatA [Pseudomonadota bacterium]
MMDLHELTVAGAARGLKDKEFSSAELTQAFLDRVAKLNDDLNIYLTLTEDIAMKQAAEADKRLAGGGALSVLDGVPVAIKDNFNTKGVRTTCASNMLRDFVPPYDATVIERLNESGMVMLGKVNMDEFASGGSTEHSFRGPSKNPWDRERVPGGTSGGSAAAVAADLACYSLGSDTGGSIRQPASFCGVTGLKVTYGRVSRSGVTAMASSWDTIGPLTKTVEDAALVLQQIAGQDVKDSTTPPVKVPDYSANLGKGVKGLKIGVPKEYFTEGIDADVESAVREALKEYEKMGAEVKEVSLPYTKYAVAAYYIVMPAELSANLARFDGIRYGSKPSKEPKDLVDHYFQARSEGFGDEIKRRIMMGTYVLSAGYYDAYYKKAQRVRSLIVKDFESVFEDVDVLVAPVAPTPAFKIGEQVGDPLSMYLADVFTIPFSCAGVPALSLPCGASKSGLPIGMQIAGPQFSEAKILQVGAAFEQATEWHKRKPQL